MGLGNGLVNRCLIKYGNLWLLILSLVGCSLPGPSYELFFEQHINAGQQRIDSNMVVIAGWGGQGLFNSRGEPNFHDHPDSNGIVFIRAFTRTYENGDHVNQDSLPLVIAPLIIQVSHPNFLTYHDTIDVNEIRMLKRISPEDINLKLRDTQVGLWILPEITLTPK